MSQANEIVSAAAPAEARGGGSWWRTLPGTLTATAGLISAITGLVVAIKQLQPAHNGGQAAAQESAAVATATAPGTPAATTPTGSGDAGGTRAGSLRVSFPGGRVVTANAGLRYDFLAAQTTVSNPGRLTLGLRVRVTNTGRYDANFWNATFRQRAGAETSSPTSFLDDVVHGGTTDLAEIDFAVAAGTRAATLLVGDDPATAVALPLKLEARR